MLEYSGTRSSDSLSVSMFCKPWFTSVISLAASLLLHPSRRSCLSNSRNHCLTASIFLHLLHCNTHSHYCILVVRIPDQFPDTTMIYCNALLFGYDTSHRLMLVLLLSNGYVGGNRPSTLILRLSKLFTCTIYVYIYVHMHICTCIYVYTDICTP